MLIFLKLYMHGAYVEVSKAKTEFQIDICHVAS